MEEIRLSIKKRVVSALLAAVMLAFSVQTVLAAEPDYLTRGEVADILVAAADDYNPGVKRTDILQGYSDGSLHEERPVTRAQALVMLRRAFGGDLPTPVGDNARSGYSSANFTDLPAWAAEDLQDVLSTGIVAGTSSTTFSPNSYVTERQMELFIQRTYALEGTNLKDDFYAAVNKKALDSSVIQTGYTGTGSFYDLAITVNQQVAQIIKEAAASPKTEGEKKISTLYNNILDTATRDKAGITPIQPYLDAVSSAKTLDELMAARNLVYRELQANLLLGFGLTVDAKDSNVYDLTFGAFSPSLGQSGYENATDSQKTAYRIYVATLLTLVGTSEADAQTQAGQIWDMEASIAAKSLTNQELQDVDKTYNLYTMAKLQKLFPNVDLSAVFTQTGYTQTDKIAVSDVEALKAGAAYFDESHLELLKTCCRLELAMSYGALLNQEFTDAANAFQQAYMGSSGAISEEKLAAQYVQSLMSDYLGKAYVDRHFSAQAKADVEKMVKEMLAVYKERIQNLTWMQDVTKAKAIHKLETMKLNIGYPDTWRDDLKDTEFLTVAQGGSFFDNVVAIAKTQRALLIQYQKDGVDKTDWPMTPDTVNACYNGTDNSITFPAAILQPPFYDVDAAYEQNLGRVGYVIAHEITHAFDNNGAKYDENGNAADWWTAADYSAFQNLCSRVVELYDGKEAAPGITCNGALTLSENIADLGAMACITEMEGKRAQPDYKALYTASAELWCSSYPREMKQYLAQADVHAPDKLRGSLVLQNFQPFYDAFGITENDGMWLAPEDRVVIW
jgi:putative endopeptidase